MNESIFPSIRSSAPPLQPGVYADLAELVRLKFRTRGFSLLPRQPVHSILAGRHASRLRGSKTAFGDAIALALTVVEHDAAVRDRVLITLTDGNDTGSQVPPVKAAEIARDRKITIHTVAVGDPTAAGEEKLDEETLKAVAATTGGRYSHANDGAALADALRRARRQHIRPGRTADEAQLPPLNPH